MAKKTTMTCHCQDDGKKKIYMGLGLLLVAAMLYLGYGWMEIFAVLGILVIIKGLFYMKK